MSKSSRPPKTDTRRANPKNSGDEKSEPSFSDLAREIDDLEEIQPGPRISHAPTKSPDAHERLDSPRGRDLHYPDPAEKLLARRSYVRKREFTQLRRGETPIDLTLDLHGLTLKDARREVLSELAIAKRGENGCVLVVPGRGVHSQDGHGLLREALPDWLAEAELESVVAAFAPAQPLHGGRGAVYVLLRR